MYGKLFVQMYDSSIVEDPEARYTLMDMVVLADQNGVVDMTHEAIARRTNRPIELIRETISRLESPDHRSRNPVEKGARLKRLDDHRDWGWMIVNHEHFRRLVSSEQKREKTAARVRRFRECNASVTLCNASNAKQKQKQDTEAEASTSSKEDVGNVDFVSLISADPTYAGIDVPREFGKMQNWCKVNNKQPTKRRFINWLNRADRPIATTSKPADDWRRFDKQGRRVDASGRLMDSNQIREADMLHKWEEERKAAKAKV